MVGIKLISLSHELNSQPYLHCIGNSTELSCILLSPSSTIFYQQTGICKAHHTIYACPLSSFFTTISVDISSIRNQYRLMGPSLQLRHKLYPKYSYLFMHYNKKVQQNCVVLHKHDLPVHHYLIFQMSNSI